jgi:N-acetylmuramoyl-L-alanine amidase
MPPPHVPKPLVERPVRRTHAGHPLIPGVPPAEAKQPHLVQRVEWTSPRTYIPVIALLMLIIGAWLLLPDPNATGWMLPTTDRSLPTVVIDPGHGGRDSGAVNNGLREKDLTLDTALRLERHLREEGFPVVLTRRDDRFLELFERAQIANGIRRALFVSIHFNDNTTASGDGVETFYAQQKAAFSDDGWTLAGLFEGHAEGPPIDQGESFAQTVQASMVGYLGVTDRGAKPRQLAVVRLTRCPAVLVEGGFLNNPVEARKLARDDYRERLATAIATGVAAYSRAKLNPPAATEVALR